ncbi:MULTISPECIES: cytochrome c [unclassified Meiothermus]|uniref:c-type cytochrome n=1 Tax=unclassified Meiothermus TaxID=370471 RepID=UPI000D7CB41F|nr:MULTISPECIES: cytochrome c [unclassified Meiothermus]PZA07377.1 cytochrome c [Meiothermus sp. Pnk-1]RYM37371.1 c-type cytochrome [Meiothermus sp. PNK-Is4]
MKTTPLALTLALSLGLAVPALAQNGGSLYQQNCAFCHGDAGQGRPGAFPPLAGHSVDLVSRPGGRSVIVQIVLFGIQGEISVNEQRYNGVMPGYAQLRDEEIASLLNFVLRAWGNDKLLPQGYPPFTAAEVAAERSRRLTPLQVYENRRRINPR